MPLIRQWFCISADHRTICHLSKQRDRHIAPGARSGPRFTVTASGDGDGCGQNVLAMDEQPPSPMEVRGWQKTGKKSPILGAAGGSAGPVTGGSAPQPAAPPPRSVPFGPGRAGGAVAGTATGARGCCPCGGSGAERPQGRGCRSAPGALTLCPLPSPAARIPGLLYGSVATPASPFPATVLPPRFPAEWRPPGSPVLLALRHGVVQLR